MIYKKFTTGKAGLWGNFGPHSGKAGPRFHHRSLKIQKKTKEQGKCF